MTRDETVAQFLKGREAWNAWAEKMLAERKVLEAKGCWLVEKDYAWWAGLRKRAEAKGHWITEKELLGTLEPKNEETRTWMVAAEADFTYCIFLVRGAEGAKELAGAEENEGEDARPPVKAIELEADRIDFSGFIFPGSARFNSTAFAGLTLFDKAEFRGDARFGNASFFRHISIIGATFWGAVYFRSAKFFEFARFNGTTFGGIAVFSRATFLSGGSFWGARFNRYMSFFGVKAERAFDFSGAYFAEVPRFNQAHFIQAPDLDDVSFPLPRFWRKGKADLVAEYRAIRRVAIQAADYEREQMAFKGEIRSKRGTEHKWYHAAFWYGLAYDALSDFGRSMSRPSLVWLTSIAVFALFYLASSSKLESAFTDCVAAGAPNYESALIISWKNALPFVGVDFKAEEIARACLYGAAAFGGLAIQGIQKVISAVLLFLFLLAVRNQFKIK